MGYAVYINEKYVGDAATTLGWQDFVDWADTLPVTKYRDVVHLAEHGWTQNIGPLAKQLAEAILEEPPDEQHTKKTARLILKLLTDVSEPAISVLVISDGAGDEGENEN